MQPVIRKSFMLMQWVIYREWTVTGEEDEVHTYNDEQCTQIQSMYTCKRVLNDTFHEHTQSPSSWGHNPIPMTEESLYTTCCIYCVSTCQDWWDYKLMCLSRDCCQSPVHLCILLLYLSMSLMWPHDSVGEKEWHVSLPGIAIKTSPISKLLSL